MITKLSPAQETERNRLANQLLYFGVDIVIAADNVNTAIDRLNETIVKYNQTLADVGKFRTDVVAQMESLTLKLAWMNWEILELSEVEHYQLAKLTDADALLALPSQKDKTA